MSRAKRRRDAWRSSPKHVQQQKWWEERLAKTELAFAFADLVRLKYGQTLEDPLEKALGDEFYERALAAFKKEKGKGSVAPGNEVNVTIFGAPGCGVYLTPDGDLWYTVMERAIAFDWAEALLLLHRVEGLAKRSCELWRVDSSSLAQLEREAETHKHARSGVSRAGAVRKVARARRAIAERAPHCLRAYELCTSIFSAVNLEKRDRLDREKAKQPLSQEPSDGFVRRIEVMRPEVHAAESAFLRAAQREAQGRYGRGMVVGVGVVALVCVALAIVFDNHDVPAWYGIALLGGGLGATVSVLQRMASGNLRLDYDSGSTMLTILGAVRPLIGAVFGMVLFAAVAGGWLPSIQISHIHPLAFYAVLGFLAGFNERFAQDMLVASATQLSTGTPETPQALLP